MRAALTPTVNVSAPLMNSQAIAAAARSSLLTRLTLTWCTLASETITVYSAAMTRAQRGDPVSDITNGTANNYISFDPSSGVTGTPARKSRVLIAAFGAGVYESTDGGTQFILLTGGASYPTAMGQMLVDSTGIIWCADVSASKIWKYTAGAWTIAASSSGGLQYRSIAENPVDGSIYCISDGGSIVRSTDKANFKIVTTAYPRSPLPTFRGLLRRMNLTFPSAGCFSTIPARCFFVGGYRLFVKPITACQTNGVGVA